MRSSWRHRQARRGRGGGVDGCPLARSGVGAACSVRIAVQPTRLEGVRRQLQSTQLDVCVKFVRSNGVVSAIADKQQPMTHQKNTRVNGEKTKTWANHSEILELSPAGDLRVFVRQKVAFVVGAGSFVNVPGGMRGVGGLQVGLSSRSTSSNCGRSSSDRFILICATRQSTITGSCACVVVVAAAVRAAHEEQLGDQQLEQVACVRALVGRIRRAACGWTDRDGHGRRSDDWVNERTHRQARGGQLCGCARGQLERKYDVNICMDISNMF
jgi:hypothetical protein